VLQFRAENRCVQIIQAAVEAVTVDVALQGAVVTQLTDPLIDVRTVGDHGTAVTKRRRLDPAQGKRLAREARHIRRGRSPTRRAEAGRSLPGSSVRP